jgi:hypothetical protein
MSEEDLKAQMEGLSGLVVSVEDTLEGKLDEVVARLEEICRRLERMHITWTKQAAADSQAVAAATEWQIEASADYVAMSAELKQLKRRVAELEGKAGKGTGVAAD